METFDLNQTERLAELLDVPPAERDDAWCDEFLDAVPNASLAAFDPQIEDGPDGFPYFQLALPDPGPLTPFSIVHIMNDILQNGVGVVIHSSVQRDEDPAWVFTLGDIASFALYDDFSGDPEIYTDEAPPPDGSVDQTLLRAIPSEDYLPATVRAAMGRFMRGPLQIVQPKIGLVSGPSLQPSSSLLVNIRLSDFGGDPDKLDSAMRNLTWFVPKTHTVMSLPDGWTDEWMEPI